MTAPSLADEIAALRSLIDETEVTAAGFRKWVMRGDNFDCLRSALARLEAMPEERERCAAIADTVRDSRIIRGRSYAECWREACREIADTIRALPTEPQEGER